MILFFRLKFRNIFKVNFEIKKITSTLNYPKKNIKIVVVTFMLLLSTIVIGQCTTQTWSGNIAIPDNDLTGITRTLTFTDTNSITDVNVTRLRIIHSWDDDLVVTLTSPAGTTIDLTRNNGGSGNNYQNTIFDDAAGTTIGAGSAPFNGTYSPDGSLSSFNGESAAGIWTLRVVDDTGADTGSLRNFDLEICTNSPPTVTAIGDQYYCLGSTINIATSVSITDPDDTSTSAVYIQISSGYVNGEDLLTLDNLGTHAANGITSTWDAVQGELTLAGPATYTNFEAAILDVLYSSSSGTATGVRQFSITVGEANYLPSTGHYYEYVPNLGITWSAANILANARTHFGLQGYLATLTTLEEAIFSGTQALGTGWIGASDVSTEGQWRWVSGPEGLENAGLGRLFWQGIGTSGNTTAPDNFHYWRQTPGNEPNQSGNEDYAHIVHPSLSGTPGSWNDLSNTGNTNSASPYHPQGFVVEYGGTVGDPVLNITAITQITVSDPSAPTGTSPQDFCSIDSPTVADLVATGTGIQWYANASGGSPLAVGTSLVDGTNYYGSQTVSGCESDTRLLVAVIILPCLSDLNLAKTVDNSRPNIGDTIKFTIVVTNNGPSSTSGVSVRDILQPGLSYVSNTTTTGSYNSATGIWNFTSETLAVGDTETLTITVTIDPNCGEIINRAEIISSNLSDPDSTPNSGG